MSAGGVVCGRVLVVLVLLVGLVVGAGCGRGRATSCDRVCAREAECAKELRLEGDRSECVQACVELERDPNVARALTAHVACVDRASSCQAVVDCP